MSAALTDAFVLYSAVNSLMAHIGMHGYVESSHDLVDGVMSALHSIDGGKVAQRVEDLREKAFMPEDQATRLAVDEFIAINKPALDPAPVAGALDAERAAFENELRKFGYNLTRDEKEPNEYAFLAARGAWLGWQARAALSTKPQEAAPASAAADSVESQEFHELAMDYRAASPFSGAMKAYSNLLTHIDAWHAAGVAAAQRDAHEINLVQLGDICKLKERAEKAEEERDQLKLEQEQTLKEQVDLQELMLRQAKELGSAKSCIAIADAKHDATRREKEIWIKQYDILQKAFNDLTKKLPEPKIVMTKDVHVEYFADGGLVTRKTQIVGGMPSIKYPKF